MKRALFILLIYFGILQFVSPILVYLVCVAYLSILSGAPVLEVPPSLYLLPSQFMGMMLMTIYLWRKGYIGGGKAIGKPVDVKTNMIALLMMLGCAWLMAVVMSHLPWIPNIMEATFTELLSTWQGVLIISLIGPIVEELVFRSTATKLLLQHYPPRKAIFISALFFGLFHINPAQVVPAFVLGLLLAWVYYKTASLIPCLLMHIVNNSISCGLMLKYPDVEDFSQLIPDLPHLIITISAAVIIITGYYMLRHYKSNYMWQKQETIEITDKELQ